MAVYRCSGFRRIDPDTDKPICEYKSERMWPGRCPSCRQPYNVEKTGADRIVTKERTTAAKAVGAGVKYVPTGLEPVDFVLGNHEGGGLVRGSTIVFGGPQGSGKSSLAVMICDAYQQRTKKPVLYVSGEQDDHAVVQICNRVGVFNEKLEIIGGMRSVHTILARCEEIRPALVVVDSIQEMSEHGGFTSTGSENVVAAKIIHDYCEKKKMSAIIISHLSGQLEYKGGTAIPHLVETEMLLYAFSSKDDGNPRKLFGPPPSEEDELDAMRRRRRRREAPTLDFNVDKVRTLMTRKNRNGAERRKVFYLMSDNGLLQPLKHNEPKTL